MTEERTYRASCHCGAVRFSFKSKTITEGLRCNCSICVRKGIAISAAYFRQPSLVTTGLTSDASKTSTPMDQQSGRWTAVRSDRSDQPSPDWRSRGQKWHSSL